MQRLLVPVLVFFLCLVSCGPGTTVQSAQRFAADYGFHVLSQAGGEVQVYPHALYYSGEGSASVAVSYRGTPLHTLQLARGQAQFRLLDVDADTGKLRLLAATCAETHARGHLTWIPCGGGAMFQSENRGATVILEYDPAGR